MIEFNLEQALPHQTPMRLIDRIIEVNDEFAQCEAIITENHLFYQAALKGIYPWVGIEIMAQTAGVFAYAKNYQSQHDKAKIGFLMSVRQFISTIDYFPLKSKLLVTAYNTFLDDSIGTFDCKIEINNDVVASTKLNAYQPSIAQLDQMLKGRKQ